MNKTTTLKAFETDTGEFNVLGTYKSAGAAKASAAGLFEMEFTDVRVKRVPYLDGFQLGSFEDDVPPDAIMAELRHGYYWYTDVDDLTDRYDPADMKTEDDWKRMAEKLGAKYPDKYKPKEKK